MHTARITFEKLSIFGTYISSTSNEHVTTYWHFIHLRLRIAITSNKYVYIKRQFEKLELFIICVYSAILHMFDCVLFSVQ